MSPLPYTLSGPGAPRSVAKCFTSAANPAPGVASPAPSSRAAKPAAVGDAAEVPLNDPNTAESNPAYELTSGFTRPSFVGPCDEYAAMLLGSAGSARQSGCRSTAPTATSAGFFESTTGLVAEPALS